MRAIFLLVALIASAIAVAQELGSGGRPVGPEYSRSPVYGKNGMAATAQPLASQVALDILKNGGSAVDAAIAANAALGLMEPTGNGIGGDLFAIIWDPKTQTLYGYNGSGRSPMGRDLQELKGAIARLKQEQRLPTDYEGIPSHGSLSVTVPGTVDGWFAMHERFGKLPMSEVLAPAIDYARDGFPVSPVIAYYFERNLARFRQVAPMIEELDNAMATYFTDGKAPLVGEVFRNPDLADTLALLAQEGRSAFYSGKLAQTIDTYMKRIGGDLRLTDLEAHRGEWVTPLGVNYKGYTLYELPPNGQGLAALMMLSILKNVDFTQWERGSPEVMHYMVEAKRLAFADMAASFTDPDFAEIPLKQLISDEYGKQQFQRIHPKQAANDYGPSEVLLEGEGDTTYLTVADASGMMVSLIQSNYRGMGSGLVPDGLGFMLQDRGELFALTEGHPNVYASGKRPFHTIIPAFLMQGDRPVMSFGLMGGGMQPQGHVQVLINWLVYGMDIQAAGDAARFLHDGGASPTDTTYEGYGVLYVEPGVAQSTVGRLRAMGHRVEYNDAGAMFGGYQAIYRNPETGVYSGATEMRKDGTVTAY
ncbi:MAG: gamma-glutamyltransferase [Aequoribacter sp.]|uniref:gamma-glutamyltransferase n=1 Tax=Aequoribacter sp. TaxID=2847771 RepID=UPI003C576132